MGPIGLSSFSTAEKVTLRGFLFKRGSFTEFFFKQEFLGVTFSVTRRLISTALDGGGDGDFSLLSAWISPISSKSAGGKKFKLMSILPSLSSVIVNRVAN